MLIGGDPGIGKSTLMLQMTMQMANGQPVLYVSGEESERQIKMRALRLMRGDGQQQGQLPENLYLVTETNLDVILGHVRTVNPRLLVVEIPFRLCTGRIWNQARGPSHRCGKVPPGCENWPRHPGSLYL